VSAPNPVGAENVIHRPEHESCDTDAWPVTVEDGPVVPLYRVGAENPIHVV